MRRTHTQEHTQDTDRQTDRQTQTDTDRQTDRQTDTHTHTHTYTLFPPRQPQILRCTTSTAVLYNTIHYISHTIPRMRACVTHFNKWGLSVAEGRYNASHIDTDSTGAVTACASQTMTVPLQLTKGRVVFCGLFSK